MSRTFRIVRSRDELALVTRRGGRTFLALLGLEVALAVVYFAGLSRVAVHAMDFMLPLAACLALIGWTAFYIRPDMRLTLNLNDRSARLVRISPLTGRRTATGFDLDDVEGLALRSLGARQGSGLQIREYAIDVALRSGGRHELRVQGALLACRATLEQFCRAAGLGKVAPAR